MVPPSGTSRGQTSHLNSRALSDDRNKLGVEFKGRKLRWSESQYDYSGNHRGKWVHKLEVGGQYGKRTREGLLTGMVPPSRTSSGRMPHSRSRTFSARRNSLECGSASHQSPTLLTRKLTCSRWDLMPGLVPQMEEKVYTGHRCSHVEMMLERREGPQNHTTVGNE
jgi:hypothetical protein